MSDEVKKDPPAEEKKAEEVKEKTAVEEKAEAKAAEEKAGPKKAEEKKSAEEIKEEVKKAATPPPARAEGNKAAAKAPTTSEDVAGPTIHVAPSPHVFNQGLTTRTLMFDVLIALVPIVAASVVVFKWQAIRVLAVTTLSAMAFEWLFMKMRGKEATLHDGSAAITGIILALSFPATAPWWVCVIASLVGIGIGKVIFGSLGQNLFNPAMVGRAFVMISFSAYLGAGAFVDKDGALSVLTQATPLTLARTTGNLPELWTLFVGNTNGSLGETSELAAIIGGIYLMIRRTASWEIPISMILAMVVFGGLTQAFVGPNPPLAAMKLTVLQHLTSGAFMFGAFFIATDPVTSPMTAKGKLWFGIGIAFFIWVLRTFSNYPEGLMFAILIMNAVVPLLNRWTVPTPVGGPVPKRG